MLHGHRCHRYHSYNGALLGSTLMQATFLLVFSSDLVGPIPETVSHV